MSINTDTEHNTSQSTSGLIRNNVHYKRGRVILSNQFSSLLTENNPYENENDPEEAAVNISTTTNVPNLKGDWLNFYLLLFLYILQGFQIDLIRQFASILLIRNIKSYKIKVLLSIMFWLCAFKVLFAPFLDSLYIQRIGRRKSWLLPIQFLIGTILRYIVKNIDDWLPESDNASNMMIVYSIFAISILSDIHYVIVDAWSLTILKKNNLGYASTCKVTGLSIGILIGSSGVFFVTSNNFANNNLLISYTYILSIIFLLTATLIGIFKKEKLHSFELDHKKISIFQSYKFLWTILKNPKIQLLGITLMTSTFGFCAAKTTWDLKLIDAGVYNYKTRRIFVGIRALNSIIIIFVSKYFIGPKSMDTYLTLTPIRLIWNIPIMVICYTSGLSMDNYNDNIYNIYYYCFLVYIFAVTEMLSVFMDLALYAFFCRLSDPCFGATYMALFQTYYILGDLLLDTFVLKIIEFLTFGTCSNDTQNSCTTSYLKKVCAANGGSCNGVYVDGYYLTGTISIVIGSVSYFAFRNYLKNYQPIKMVGNNE